MKDYREEFSSNGYIVLKNFFKKDLTDATSKSIKSLIKFHLEKHNLQGIKNIENDGLIRLNEIRKDKNKFDSIQVIYNTIRKLPNVYRLIGDTNLTEIVKQLSGINEIDANGAPYLWEAFCRIDPPSDRTYNLSWHQESYFTLPNSNSVQLWAPLINDITIKDTGSMVVLSKSHKAGEMIHHIVRQNENYITEYILDETVNKLDYKEIKMELNVGDAVLFHQHLIHKTLHNLGNKCRYTLTANYANPYLRDFSFMNEDQVVYYHKSRTANSKDFPEYISKFVKKGGIKEYSSVDTH